MVCLQKNTFQVVFYSILGLWALILGFVAWFAKENHNCNDSACCKARNNIMPVAGIIFFCLLACYCTIILMRVIDGVECSCTSSSQDALNTFASWILEPFTMCSSLLVVLVVLFIMFSECDGHSANTEQQFVAVFGSLFLIFWFLYSVTYCVAIFKDIHSPPTDDKNSRVREVPSVNVFAEAQIAENTTSDAGVSINAQFGTFLPVCKQTNEDFRPLLST